MKASLRASFAALASSVALLVASTALAEGEACFNDDDCPGTACGDSVCNWSKSAAVPDGDKRFYCNPAGSQPKGNDGWCTDDTDCKCKAQGATCGGSNHPYCTFTKASDAPAGGGTAGAASTGGSATGGTPASAGTTSTAGTATTAGTTSSGGTGAAPAPADEGGCSVSAPRASGSGVAFGLGLLGLGYVLARRRR